MWSDRQVLGNLPCTFKGHSYGVVPSAITRMMAEPLEKAFRVVLPLLGGARIKKTKTGQLIWKMKLAPWRLVQKPTDELVHVLL